MKMNKLSMLIASVGIIAAQSTFAADGTITINGKITDASCTVAVNGSANGTVTLPTVSATTLATTGSTAGTTPFGIDLTNCTGSTLQNAYAYFEAGTMVDTATGRLNTTGNTNTQIQLLDKNNAVIAVGSAAQVTSPVAEDVSAGYATLNYYARYYAPGANNSVTAGIVSTQVNYTVIYD